MSTRTFLHQSKDFLRRVRELNRPYLEAIHRFWDTLRIRAKLSILFAGMILVMTSFFYGFAVYQTTREIKISAIHKGEAVAEALKDEVSYVLIAGNFPALNYSFKRLVNSRHDIGYVYLLNPRGIILSHSDSDQVGRALADRNTTESLADPGTRVKFFQGDEDKNGRTSEICNVSVPVYARGKRMATLHIGVSLTRYLANNAPRIRTTLAWFIIPFSIFAILIAMRVAHSITKPLQDLARAASDVSKGDYTIRLPLERRDELGEVAQSFNRMAANLKENFDKVSDMANRDGLTGLYNSRFFRETLARELERVKRTTRPFSLMLLDGDKFKRINDRYGHPVGDLVLQHISQVAKSVLRGYDMLARYGGEEFIAMLPDATASQAVLLAERLRQAIEQKPLPTENSGLIRVTLSIGVAQARAPYDGKELISQADQALYTAKETGRNRVVLFRTNDQSVKSTTPEPVQTYM